MKEKIWDETLKMGNGGEEFLKKFCKSNNIQYKKGTTTENLISGVDCYVASVSTDVKTTCKIFLCKYILSSNKFFVRHPFRKETKARNYAIINGDGKDTPFSLRYLGSVEEYLEKTYFLSNFSYERVKGRLQLMEEKSYKQLGYLNPDQMMLSLKTEISHHLKPRIYCTFVSTDQAANYKSNELNICLMTYLDHQKMIKEGKSLF